MASIWQKLGLQDKRNLYIAITLPIIGITAAKLLKNLLSPPPGTPEIYNSPRKSLQLLSKQDVEKIPYPSDALPGARDVDTPYGNIRVYEWGAEYGRKVLFVHGISTPCIAFAGMAKLLVEQGCRVMLFDLFGRGYSDAPDPRFYRQDIGLWTSQILLVLSSSKIAWTGLERFTMIGYSMGGGISVGFTSYFPELVESLVLIAPGGLIRPHRINRSSRWLYGSVLPQFLVDHFVRRRLRGSSAPSPSSPEYAESSSEKSLANPGQAAESEVPDSGHPANAPDSQAPLFPDRPGISVAKTVDWELDAHPGFLPSFISSIRYAPVSGEHASWRRIGSRCIARRASTQPEQMAGLDENKVLVLLGEQDSVIVAEETKEDITDALGEENVRFVMLPSGHDVPIVDSKGCADAIADFWNSKRPGNGLFTS